MCCRDAVLILAGDVTDDLRILRSTLEHITAAFGTVFFIPGNHELWVKGPDKEVRYLPCVQSMPSLTALSIDLSDINEDIPGDAYL
jgi:hypothetical protein